MVSAPATVSASSLSLSVPFTPLRPVTATSSMSAAKYVWNEPVKVNASLPGLVTLRVALSLPSPNVMVWVTLKSLSHMALV